MTIEDALGKKLKGSSCHNPLRSIRSHPTSTDSLFFKVHLVRAEFAPDL